ncbi:MAG: c-type cytochrome [Burkholderiaceae bacterium]
MKLPLSISFSITITITSIALAASAIAGPAEDLIAANKCNKCHTAKTTKKGPSFASIAEKYKGQADAPAKLAELLKTGGTDDHDKVAASDADLRAIAAFVLAAK